MNQKESGQQTPVIDEPYSGSNLPITGKVEGKKSSETCDQEAPVVDNPSSASRFPITGKAKSNGLSDQQAPVIDNPTSSSKLPKVESNGASQHVPEIDELSSIIPGSK